MSAFEEVYANAREQVTKSRSSTDDTVQKAHTGFEALVAHLKAAGHSDEEARGIAAHIGRQKYGAHIMSLAAAHNRSAPAEEAAERRGGVGKNLLPSSETGYRGSASSHPDGRRFEKAEFPNPPVPSPGANTLPRDEGGRFQSAQYQGGTGADFARQPSAADADGNPPGAGYDTEAAASHGYGRADASDAGEPTGAFEQALQRPQQGISRYRLHVVNPRLAMLAASVARNAVTEFDEQNGQPVATARFNPDAVPCPDDLNPYVLRELMHKIRALTVTFYEATGRWPVVGDGDQEDYAYREAFQQLIDAVYGPAGTFGTWLQ